MRTITPALKEHMAQEVTTLASCWFVQLTNGAQFGFTDHTRDLQIANLWYRSSGGFTPTAVDNSGSLAIDNMEIEAVLNSPLIQEKDLMAGKWDFATVEFFLVNYNDLAMGKLVLKFGSLGQVSIKQNSFVAEVRGLTQAYSNVLGELTSGLCRARLGDARCKVDLAPFTFQGTVTGVDATFRTIQDTSLTQPGPAGGVTITNISQAKRAVVTTDGPHSFGPGENILITNVTGVTQVGTPPNDPGNGGSINGYSFGIGDVTASTFSIALDTRAPGSTDINVGPPLDQVYSAYVSGGTATPQGHNGFFDHGTVTFTSGLNAGLSMEVKSYVPGIAELQLPMPYQIQVGDTYTIVAGCGKRFIEDCKTKFNNVINFRGEPHLPGVDQMMYYGSPVDGLETTQTPTQ